jgi:hypothetical protein
MYQVLDSIVSILIYVNGIFCGFPSKFFEIYVFNIGFDLKQQVFTTKNI